ATGLGEPSHTFAGGAPEGEGTWTYRVQASDGTLTSAFSPVSDSVVVDKSAPSAPTLSADRSPDYAGGGGWYKNSVTMSSADNGDPALADGSAGSGVDAATVGPGATFSTSGSHTATDTVLDNARNQSVAASLTVQVDATLPNIAFSSCPATVILSSAASASWSASDDHSGLASAAGGSETLDTASIGSKTVSATGTDNVGLERTASCAYSVIYDFTGFFRPIDNLPTLNSVKAGQAIPVKFSLNGDQGLGILATGFPTSKTSTCQVAAAEDVIEETVTAGGSSLSYDAVSDQYVYVWKTDKAWAGTCRTLTVKLTDGTIHQALFKLYK
ncbi:MAG TPA: PxKF domain-containing protein, partial [Candidatus Limnocylindrales bacterium]|nr:PxKF domain-containing protein [Candidatus Limnocylindrales bacterium]